MIISISKNKIALVLVASAILIFSSCSDDNFIETTSETEIIYPDTLPYISTTGKVTNINGDPLADVNVDFLVGDEEMSTRTNEDGFYSIRDINVSDKRKKLFFHGEGYLPKIDIVTNENKNIVRDVILAEEGSIIQGPNNIAELSLSDSLIIVSGRLINQDGEGISD